MVFLSAAKTKISKVKMAKFAKNVVNVGWGGVPFTVYLSQILFFSRTLTIFPIFLKINIT